MKKRKWGLLACTVIALICLGICALPFPQHVQLVTDGAEVDFEGNAIGFDRMAIDAWIYHYLLLDDVFVLSNMELPNRQVDSVFDYAYPITNVYGDSEYFITNGRILLPEYTSQQVYTANIIYNEDHTCWVVEVTDRIFVCTVETDPDYVQIMNDFSWIVEGFLEG